MKTKKFEEAKYCIFVGCVLADRLIDVYQHIEDGKKLWDELNVKLCVSDAGSTLCSMERFHDYKLAWVADLYVVEQMLF
jgi:hypothetical protein